MQAHLPSVIQEPCAAAPCQPGPTPDVGADAQWLADLETLERLEQQALYPDPCFFCAAGELMAGRVRG